MVTTKGYIFEDKTYDTTKICIECSNKLNLNTKNGKSINDKLYCPFCDRNAHKKPRNVDYPSIISTIVYFQFINKGKRYEVKPMRHNSKNEQKVTKSGSVKFSTGFNTNHDMITFDTKTESLANEVAKFLDKLSNLISIQYRMNEINFESPSGEPITEYEFEVIYLE